MKNNNGEQGRYIETTTILQITPIMVH